MVPALVLAQVLGLAQVPVPELVGHMPGAGLTLAAKQLT